MCEIKERIFLWKADAEDQSVENIDAGGWGDRKQREGATRPQRGAPRHPSELLLLEIVTDRPVRRQSGGR